MAALPSYCQWGTALPATACCATSHRLHTAQRYPLPAGSPTAAPTHAGGREHVLPQHVLPQAISKRWALPPVTRRAASPLCSWAGCSPLPDARGRIPGCGRNAWMERDSDGACLYGDVRASEHKPNRALAQPDGHAPGACAPPPHLPTARCLRPPPGCQLRSCTARCAYRHACLQQRRAERPESLSSARGWAPRRGFRLWVRQHATSGPAYR
ncbi:hypothetical protein B0H14DRAFT_1497557 [Mycena olivaceomarginata]|nr:hypothetical protein B0H14DRAFT_1497557 [Mycena olivaceomarginata]